MRNLLYGFGPAASDGRELIDQTKRERQLLRNYLRFLAVVYYPELHAARGKVRRRKRIRAKRTIARLGGLAQA